MRKRKISRVLDAVVRAMEKRIMKVSIALAAIGFVVMLAYARSWILQRPLFMYLGPNDNPTSHTMPRIVGIALAIALGLMLYDGITDFVAAVKKELKKKNVQINTKAR